MIEAGEPVKPINERMLSNLAKYTTYIVSENARAQAEFYTHALGGEITSVMTRGQLPGAAEGGKIVCPLEPASWGSLFGQIEDPFGIRWMITTAAPTA